MRRILLAALLIAGTAAAETRPVNPDAVARHYGVGLQLVEEADCSTSSHPIKTVCRETQVGATENTLWWCPEDADDSTCVADDWEQVGGTSSASSLSDGDYGDFSCAASVCTVDANAVELGTDTTGNYKGSNAEGQTTLAFYAGFKIATTADDVYIKVVGGAITLVGLDCAATGSTTPSAFVLTADECDSNATNCVASGGTVTLSALVTNTADTTFTDSAVDDDDWVRIDVTSLTTAPDFAWCRLEYTQP